MVGTECWGAKAIAEGLTSPQSQREPKAPSSNKAEKSFMLRDGFGSGR